MVGKRIHAAMIEGVSSQTKNIDGKLTIILMIKPDTLIDLQSSGLRVSLRGDVSLSDVNFSVSPTTGACHSSKNIPLYPTLQP